jgi:aryl-alcohol dehydrogenase-like predicted oxidoreductase
MLTGKYRRGEPAPPGSRLAREPELRDDALFDTIEALARFAAERGIELLDVALGGLAAQPGVATVIAGATSVRQVERNAAAVRWRPTEADRAELDRISPTRRPVRLDER